ncbi:hypothetical protein ES703_115683 [subsurface metagenome]
MAKTKYEKELEKQDQAQLVYMCEGKGLLHTGNREALIARLVEWEKSQEPEPEIEPAPEPEPETVAEPEPETPEPED